MKRYKAIIFSIIPCVLCLSFYKADDRIEKLKEMLFAYTQEHPVTDLYLHMDKNFYMPGETVWFKAYLPSDSQFQSEALYVRIVNDKQDTVMEREFLVYDIRSHGDLTLPDTLEQGTYQLYAFTDKMVNFGPRDVFVQEFRVSNTGAQLVASAVVRDTASLKPGKTVEIECFLKANGVGVEKGKVTYQIKTGDDEVVAKGKLTTSVIGRSVISFVYPAIDPFQNLKLEADFTKDNSKTELLLNLPPQERKIIVEATVEGGKLVAGIKSRLLVETRDNNGRPVSSSVVLKNNNTEIAEIATDSMGQGIVEFTPGENSKYSFALRKGSLTQTTDFPLTVEPSGWSIKIANSEKQRSAVIHNQGMPEDATLVLRSMQEILWDKEITLKSGDSLVVQLPHVDSVKQVLNLALFDGKGTLQGERLFLTRQQENYTVAIKLDKSGYGTKEKVRVTMQVKDKDGKPVAGNLSVAVVASRALDEKSYRTILETTYNALNDGRSTLFLPGDDANDALIARKWRRYGWPAVLTYQPKGSLKLLANSAGVVGYIKGKKERYLPEEAENVFLFTSTVVRPLIIRPDGGFSIAAAELETDGSSENYIWLNDDFHYRYTMELRDYVRDFDRQIISSGVLEKPVEYLTAVKPPEKPLFNESVRLREVEITASASGIDSLTYQKLLRNYPDNCKDYICINGILNCETHKEGLTKPIIGKVYPYKYREHPDLLYTKCLIGGLEPGNIILKSISKPMEFPLPDYQKEPISTPEFLSTIFWNPNINTDEKGNAAFEFYTSDLKGTYKIIVQGLEVGSLRGIYGKTEFMVK